MKRYVIIFLFLLIVMPSVSAASDSDINVARLNNSLSQLDNDPTLSQYAQAERTRARDAIAQLAQGRSRAQAYLLYMAERRVDLARAAAELQQARYSIQRLERQHDQILLEVSRRNTEVARRQLERQRIQYQLLLEQAQQQQAAGQAVTNQALAQVQQAKKLAEAQAKVAAAARREAMIASAAARALRQQMERNEKQAADTKHVNAPPNKK